MSRGRSDFHRNVQLDYFIPRILFSSFDFFAKARKDFARIFTREKEREKKKGGRKNTA